MIVMVSSAKPPRASATMRMKSTPAERQAERWDASVRCTLTCRAWPGVKAASAMVCCWRGLITCTSSAAGRPQLQVGRKTSAGLERESKMRLGTSLDGDRAADWAAQKMTSRIALCRKILSPFPPDLQKHQQHSGTPGRSRESCEGELPANSGGTPGPATWQMERH